ncbi:MAG: hypothetical protein L0Z55_02845 [Planctomycetes bacterium]|nr:hypothetical protein [Planctomycetota bacterium]
MLWELLFAAVIGAAIFLVLVPLLRAPVAWVRGDGDAARTLLRQEKNRILRALKDLEVERETGALAEAEHARVHAMLVVEAAEVNRRLDALDGGARAGAAGSGAMGGAADER